MNCYDKEITKAKHLYGRLKIYDRQVRRQRCSYSNNTQIKL